MEYETDPRKAALLNMELGRLKKKKDSLQVTNIEIKPMTFGIVTLYIAAA